MTNIDELQANEIASLEEDEIFDLESLITDGVNAKIPIVIEFPNKNGEMVKAAAMIRPLSNIEWNNAVRLNRGPNSGTTNDVELVKKGLYTKNGDPFPPELVEAIPAGVLMNILKKIAEISGLELFNEENLKFAKDVMGF